jgi:hypothetical protein
VGPQGLERFTDTLAPVAVGAALNYPAATTRATRRARLTSAGRTLGWVWTDDVGAAGWVPVEQSQEAVLAASRVWVVHAAAARAGEAVSVVLESGRYAPFVLDEPTVG